MSGAITSGMDNIIKRGADNRTLTIFGAQTAQNGGNISLYGKDHEMNGGFAIRAANGSSIISLQGYTDGSLTWNGKPVNVGGVYITQTWVSGTSWYRVWSDGYIEQGGISNSSTWNTITLSKPYSNTNYSILLGTSDTDTNNYLFGISAFTNKTNTSFLLACGYENRGTAVDICWMTNGY